MALVFEVVGYLLGLIAVLSAPVLVRRSPWAAGFIAAITPVLVWIAVLVAGAVAAEPDIDFPGRFLVVSTLPGPTFAACVLAILFHLWCWNRHRPRLELNPKCPCPVKRTGFVWRSEQFEADVLSMQIVNAARSNWEDAIGRRMQATLEVYGEPSGTRLLSLPARWSDIPQPKVKVAGAGLTYMEELPQNAVDFATNGDDSLHELNIAIKRPGSNDCHLFSNASYYYPRFEKPEWSLQAGRYRAVVKIAGIRLWRSFECVFVNQKGGSLEVVSCRRVRGHRR